MKERKVHMLGTSELFMNRKKLLLIGFVRVLCVLMLLWVLRSKPFVGSPELTVSTDCSGYQAAVPSGDVIITDSLLMPSPNPDSLEEAVSRAVKSQGKSYLAGEAVTEGHIILDSEEKDGQVKVYTIAAIGWFSFENEIFTTVSGSGPIPTVMTFSKNENGVYVLLRYQEPQDGALLTSSVKKMFPQKLWPQVLTEDKWYPELVKQKENPGGSLPEKHRPGSAG